MIFIAVAILLFFGARAYDLWRTEREIERWIDKEFGTNIHPIDRLRIRRLYFPRG